jgi:hypothetical protein
LVAYNHGHRRRRPIKNTRVNINPSQIKHTWNTCGGCNNLHPRNRLCRSQRLL